MNRQSMRCDCGAIIDVTGYKILANVTCNVCGKEVFLTPRRVQEAERSMLQFPFAQFKSLPTGEAEIKSVCLAFQQCLMIASGREFKEAFLQFATCGRCLRYDLLRRLQLEDADLHPFMQQFAERLYRDHWRSLQLNLDFPQFIQTNGSVLLEAMEEHLASVDKTILMSFLEYRHLSGYNLDIHVEEWLRKTPPTPKPKEIQEDVSPTPTPKPKEEREGNTPLAPAPRPRIEMDLDMPELLRNQVSELEEWAQANRKDARKDALAFWLLKIPAILSAASAGLFAYFELPVASLITSAVSTFCILVDGILPRGLLRNTHLRAFHDIRILTSNMVSKWRTRSVNANSENIAKKIIKEAEQERLRIASYIRDAETALKYEDRPGK